MIPEILHEWLESGWNVPNDDGFLGFKNSCDGSKHHSPGPLVLHRMSLIPHQEFGPFAMLCGTCRDNFKVYQSLIIKHDGAIPWNVQRQFGNKIRQLVMAGWKGYLEQRASEA